MTFFLVIISFLGSLFFTQTEPLVQNQALSVAKFSSAVETKLAPELNLNQPLSAKAYLVKERNGKVLLHQQANQVFPIASLTKIFSSYVALKYLPENSVITMSKQAVAQEGIAGLFQVGERFLRDELIRAGLILSANDAVYALAEYYGLENFLFLLKQTLRQFDLTKTHLVEPTGLSPGNVSTAEDILRFVFAIKNEFPQIWSWSIEKNITLDGFYQRKFNNINLAILDKYQEELLFQKTGFTDEAGKTLTAVVKLKNSPEVGIVLLGSTDREKDLDLIMQALREYYE